MQAAIFSILFFSAVSVQLEVEAIKESGLCSWYGAEGEISSDDDLASEQTFDRFGMNAAHETLPFGTHVRVTNKNNGKSVVVTINDRRPLVPGRILDLTSAAFSKIENGDAKIVPCSFETIAVPME